MTKELQPKSAEAVEIPIPTPRLIEIFTPTQDSYSKLVNVKLFQDPENKEGRLLKLDYLKQPIGDGDIVDEFIEVTDEEFQSEIIPWFYDEMQRVTGLTVSGETIFQDIQELLIASDKFPSTLERRRLTSILLGLAEVQYEFDTREVVDEIED